MNLKYFQGLLIISIISFLNTLNAQEIKGFVSTIDKEPITGVSVYFKSNKIAETNEKGIFILTDSFKLPLKLRLEHPDYFRNEVEVSDSNPSFILAPLSKAEDLEEVRITKLILPDTSTTPTPDLIISTPKIRAKQFNGFSPIDLVSAINETPGVFIQSGAINTNRITIRGIGSRTLYGTNKIRAYFNGFPITNGIGETAIDIYDPEDLQSLQIIKGPKATQYGTNLGGTLLLNPKQVKAGQSVVSSSLTVGSYNLVKNNVSAGTATEKFSLNLNYDHLETEGFRENNNYDRSTLLLTSTYKFNANNALSVLVNYIDYYAQIPSSIGKTAFEENPSQAAFTWKKAKGYEDNKQLFTGLGFFHRFSRNFKNTTRIFFNYLDHYEPRPFNILDEYTTGLGARTTFEKDFHFLNYKASISFGGEFFKDEYHWKTIENLYEENNNNGSLEGKLLSENVEKRDNLNVFSLLTLQFTERLKGQFGLNFNKTNYSFIDEFNLGKANKDADRDFDPIIAPNVILRYQFSENLSSYFNFSRGFNFPSIEETLTPNGVINPELGPEKGFNYEMGIEIFQFKRKLHLEVKAYRMDIKDLLVARRVGNDEYIGRNAGRTEHKGIELQLSYLQSLAEVGYILPYFNAEFTDHKFIDFVDGDNYYSGKQLTGVPKQKINGGLKFGYKNLNFNCNFLHIGQIPLNDANELFSKDYTVLNTKATYKANLTSTLSFEINAGINNFTDEQYASSILINATGFGKSEPRYYYPGLPRNWYGGFKMVYKL